MPFDLHLQMQEHFAGENGECEVQIGSFRADVLRDGVIYEIQTQKLRGIRGKIAGLLDDWPVVVVYPVATVTTIVYCEGDPPTEIRRRRSPRHGTAYDAFVEAVSLAKMLPHPNLELAVPLVAVEDYRRRRTDAEKEAMLRRRKRHRKVGDWETINRRVVDLSDVVRLDCADDGLRFIPDTLPERFTSRMFGESCGLAVWRARQVLYTLRHMGTIEVTGRTKEGYGYERCSDGCSSA